MISFKINDKDGKFLNHIYLSELLSEKGIALDQVCSIHVHGVGKMKRHSSCGETRWTDYKLERGEELTLFKA